MILNVCIKAFSNVFIIEESSLKKNKQENYESKCRFNICVLMKIFVRYHYFRKAYNSINTLL